MNRKSTRKVKDYAKKAYTSRLGMYRVPTGQVDFDNFAISFGGKLRRDNRWVILADKIYRPRDNLKFCKEKRIRLTGPKLGRP